MRPAERDEVRALLAEAYQPYSTEMPPEVYEQYLEGVLDTEEGTQLVALDEGGKLLGAARLYLPGTATVPLPPDWAWVRSVGVRPSARGTGVGRAIMAYCGENVGDATAIALHTMDFMPDAIRLYERLGYTRVPEYDFTGGDGAFHVMAYRLDLPALS
jgi:GNAT superfamily N-acetyltransferase